ncbi:MAG: hypothetical protein WBG57_13710, partial [Ornithinimicrobium sp.]
AAQRAANEAAETTGGEATGATEPSTGAEPAFIPSDEGRMAIDAGTCASVQRSIKGIGGTVLYVAASPEHATQLVAHGMPEDVLLSS